MFGKAYETRWNAIRNMLRNTLKTWETCWEPIAWTRWELGENTFETTKNPHNGVKPTVKEGVTGFSLYLEKKAQKLFTNFQVASTDPQISMEINKNLIY